MPELPEVQIQVNELRRRLRGRRVRRVVSRDPKLPVPSNLAGRRIRDVTRRAKYIVFHLSDGRYLLAHLRMTGWWQFAEPAKWRVAIMTARATAYLEDQRRFGTLRVVTARQLDRQLAALGLEPLNGAFDPLALRRTKRPIKVALLDQRLVAGVGNIYASEALFRARVDPRRAAHRLRTSELQCIHRGLAAAMRKAIAYGPRIFSVQRFYVYDREGRPCRRCQTPVRRIVQAQRSTFWCPQCQR
jgi:formamidopyrimidine-DNA glycosylase